MKPRVQLSAFDVGAKTTPVAPPVYRPQPAPHVLQAKASPVAELNGHSRRGTTPLDRAAGNRQVPVCLRPPSARLPSSPPMSRARAVQLAEAASEAEKRAARKKRFVNEHKELEEAQKANQIKIDPLKKGVDSFGADVAAHTVMFVNGPAAKKHGYQDPIGQFKQAFKRASWDDINARQTDDGLYITTPLRPGETVTGRYAHGVLTLIHCGGLQGPGYGIALGDQ